LAADLASTMPTAKTALGKRMPRAANEQRSIARFITSTNRARQEERPCKKRNE
jgi:hypothetical protein